MIKKSDLGKIFKKILNSVDSTEQARPALAIQRLFHHLIVNWGELEEGLKEDLDKMREQLLPQLKQELENLPASKNKRVLKRMWKGAAGKHLSSDSLIRLLERPASAESEILKETRRIFVLRLQNNLDLLSDATDLGRKGNAEFAKIGLFYLCVDELLAAFHLCQHSFISQSCTHLRSILEALDKIELFDRQPDVARLWMAKHSDPRQELKRQKEFGPSAVRKKLGIEKYDFFYNCLSEFGPHGTFRVIQSRSGVSLKPVDGKRQINFWIGGSPFKHNIILGNSNILYTLFLVLDKIRRVYGHLLEEEELKEIFTEVGKEFKNFNERYVIPWANECGLNIQPLIDHCKNWPGTTHSAVDRTQYRE